jgi:hypothetical protein
MYRASARKERKRKRYPTRRRRRRFRCITPYLMGQHIRFADAVGMVRVVTHLVSVSRVPATLSVCYRPRHTVRGESSCYAVPGAIECRTTGLLSTASGISILRRYTSCHSKSRHSRHFLTQQSMRHKPNGYTCIANSLCIRRDIVRGDCDGRRESEARGKSGYGGLGRRRLHGRMQSATGVGGDWAFLGVSHFLNF